MAPLRGGGGGGTALCRAAATILLAVSAWGQTPLPMGIQQTVSDYAEWVDPGRPGKERRFIVVIENLAPSSASQYNMIEFNLQGLSSSNPVYRISSGTGFQDWTTSFHSQPDGSVTLRLKPSSEDALPLPSDGLTNNYPLAQISFYTPFSRLRTNAATAVALGTIESGNLPFASVAVVVPDARPQVYGCAWAGGTLTLQTTNLAPGWSYTLRESPDLVAWTNRLSFTATNDSQTLSVTTTNPAAFYRLSSP